MGGGKSELHRATQGLTALRRKARNSGTERISEALIQSAGTGADRGAGGVKTAKLCVKQDQIGKHELTSVSSKRGSRETSGSDRLSV